MEVTSRHLLSNQPGSLGPVQAPCFLEAPSPKGGGSLGWRISCLWASGSPGRGPEP